MNEELEGGNSPTIVEVFDKGEPYTSDIVGSSKLDKEKFKCPQCGHFELVYAKHSNLPDPWIRCKYCNYNSINNLKIEKKQYYIKIDKSIDSTMELPSDDPYDRGNEYHSHEIRGIRSSTDKNEIINPDFIIEGFNRDIPYFLVYVLYKTGDSFGSSYGNIELIELVEDATDALVIKKLIEDDYKKYQETDKHTYEPLKLTLPISKKEISISTGAWCGYFERLEHVKIELIQNIEL